MVAMKIREATAADVEEIAALSGELGYPSGAEEIGRRMSTILGRDDQSVYVAEAAEGSVVGWIHVFGALRLESEPFAELGGLVVSDPHRGRGIGKLLCEQARRWASENGFRALRVRSRAEREAAHRFYERLGFRRVKTQQVLSLDL